eukprot:Mrub_10281.p1 GENE.Mrub_10281~~Mrub_10281.p1  ORF type:complete len:143 (+),score=1.02 Mrub_10281:189-617(+)
MDSADYYSVQLTRQCVTKKIKEMNFCIGNTAEVTHDGYYYYVNLMWLNKVNVYEIVYPYKKPYTISCWIDKNIDSKNLYIAMINDISHMARHFYRTTIACLRKWNYNLIDEEKYLSRCIENTLDNVNKTIDAEYLHQFDKIL